MSILSALAKAGAIFRPGKGAPRAKSLNPTTLRVGVDGDDESRIVFIIEDGASGQQFSHVSLTPEGALQIAEVIMDIADDMGVRPEEAAQADELSAMEAFQAHCDGLARDAKLNAYLKLARVADDRIVAKLEAKLAMHASKGVAMPGSVFDMSNTEPQEIADAAELARRRAVFEQTLKPMVAATRAQSEAVAPVESSGQAAEDDKSHVG